MIDKQLHRVVKALMQDLNTSRSRLVLSLIERVNGGEQDALRALLDLRVDPGLYDCPDTFFRDYQATEFLRKLDIKGDVKRLSREAQETFLQCERACAETNLRLNPFVCGVFDHPDDLAIFDFIKDCKKFARDVLGPVPSELPIKFGPGATFNDRGCLTTIPDKMTSQPTITPGAVYLLPLVRDTAWFRALYERSVSCVHPLEIYGNRFTTVPKDATKRRGICIEPSINLSLQLSLGAHLKARLKMKGLDLKNGQQLHRSLACRASRDGSLATIDLSNASDTVAYSLVKLILPEGWFELFDSLRSGHTLIKNQWFKLSKFSSMGNGYTFELETLIFASIIHACGGKVGDDSFVYGDDIIVPSRIAESLLPALRYFGFTPNPRKTFTEGHFRESCGGDFFKGVPVRPHYLKELPNEPQDWIKLANGLRRVANRHADVDCRWHLLQRAWFRCMDALPVNIRRLRGPDELGDLVINDDTWDTQWYSDGMGRVKVYKPVARPLPWNHWHPGVQLASALYGVPSEGPIPRTNVAGYRISKVIFS